MYSNPSDNEPNVMLWLLITAAKAMKRNVKLKLHVTYIFPISLYITLYVTGGVTPNKQCSRKPEKMYSPDASKAQSKSIQGFPNILEKFWINFGKC